MNECVVRVFVAQRLARAGLRIEDDIAVARVQDQPLAARRPGRLADRLDPGKADSAASPFPRVEHVRDGRAAVAGVVDDERSRAIPVPVDVRPVQRETQRDPAQPGAVRTNGVPRVAPAPIALKEDRSACGPFVITARRRERREENDTGEGGTSQGGPTWAAVVLSGELAAGVDRACRTIAV